MLIFCVLRSVALDRCAQQYRCAQQVVRDSVNLALVLLGSLALEWMEQSGLVEVEVLDQVQDAQVQEFLAVELELEQVQASALE